MIFGNRYCVNIYYPDTGCKRKFIGEFNHLRGNEIDELRVQLGEKRKWSYQKIE